MVKIITKKSQIPKSAQKKIKNFKKLTDNQAIYQYELNKLVKRAKGDYGQFLKGYYHMPSRVTKKAIEEIRSLRNVRLRYSREKYETERRIDRITRDRIEYERPRIEQPVVENPLDDYDLYDYSDYYEPSDAIDINDLIEKEKQYDNVKDYLEETGQAINPFTGEVLEAQAVGDIIESAREYLSELRELVLQEIDRAVISASSYRSGRKRSTRSREWVENNINKAGDMVLREIDRIEGSEESLKSFAKKFSSSSQLQELSEAISEYLASAYHITDSGSSFQSSRVYMILHDGPITLADTMEFEDEE